MPSLDQIQALSALKNTGTFMQAAEYLGKSYSSINYSLRTLEEELNLTLLDRRSYRTKLTAHGLSILDAGQKILIAHDQLLQLAQNLKSGWEPNLNLVYDGVLDIHPVMSALSRLKKEGVSTKITTHVAFHEKVEEEFLKMNADFMITISPPADIDLPSLPLPPIKVYLVASAKHELIQARKKHSLTELQDHSLVTVRGSSMRLGLSTLELEKQSHFIVSDFASKKFVILEGLGFGWLPEYIMKKELKNNTLKVISSEISTEHKFYPRLYHRPIKTIGKSGRLLLNYLSEGIL